jgi:septal ring factor EnvC (AmiA/AmiB activator)
LRRRLEELAARAAKGSDVSGPFAVLEAAAARAERDLIVAAASHRELSRDYRATLARRRDLETQEEALRVLVARAVSLVRPVPRMAVPDVERLGRVPQIRAELDAYRAKLDNVERAMTMATAAYNAVLAELTDLRSRLDAYAAKAASTGQSGDPVVAATYDLAHGVLWLQPCPVHQARELVTAYQRLLGSTPPGGSAS